MLCCKQHLRLNKLSAVEPIAREQLNVIEGLFLVSGCHYRHGSMGQGELARRLTLSFQSWHLFRNSIAALTLRVNDRREKRDVTTAGGMKREEGEEMGARTAVCQVSKNERTACCDRFAIGGTCVMKNAIL
jgi:hypothetical protein